MCRNNGLFRYGLCLVIATTVVFLIGITTVYISYMVVWYKTSSCERLCCRLSNMTRYNKTYANPYGDLKLSRIARSIRMSEYLDAAPDGVLDGDHLKFPFVGALLDNSLTWNAHVTLSKSAVCALVLLSNSWAVASVKCFDGSPTTHLKVSFGSSFWSMNTARNLKQLGKVYTADNHAFAVVNFPPLEIQNLSNLASVSIANETFSVTTFESSVTFYTMTWFSDRYKYKMPYLVKMRILPRWQCPDIPFDPILDQSIVCGFDDGNPRGVLLDDLKFPLINEHYELVAVYFDKALNEFTNQWYHYYVDILPYKDWMITKE